MSATKLNNEQAVLEALEAPFTLQLEAASSIKGTMKEHDASSRDLWMVKPSDLRVIPGFNPRVHNASYEAKIRAYAESMLENGWLANSVLAGYTAIDPETHEKIVYVTDGHTRLKALELAKKKGRDIPEVPVTVIVKGVSMEDLNVALIQANEKNSLSVYEKGVVCKRLLDNGVSEADVQRRTGVKNPWFGKIMKLMAAPYKLKEHVAFERVAVTLAIDMIEEYGPKALEKIEEALASKAAANAQAGEKQEGDVAKSNKITGKDIKDPAKTAVKVFKKFAPTMHSTLTQVQSDPGFSKLAPATQEALAKLMVELQAAKSKALGEDVSEVPEDPNQIKLFDATTVEKETA